MNRLQNHEAWNSWNPARRRLVTAGDPLSERLNPYAREGVEIRPACLYADTFNLKAPVAYQLLLKNVMNGNIGPDTTVVCPSSGNTGFAVAQLGNALGIKTLIVMPRDAPTPKFDMIRMLGHPADVIPASSNTLTHSKELVANNPGYYLLDQYADDANIEGQARYLAPQLFDAIGDVDVIVAAGGTLGTISGLQRYAKEQAMTTKFVVAVCAPGEEVPAGRDRKRIERDVSIASLDDFDDVVEGTRYQAFLTSHAMFSEVAWLAPGPTSGLALFAALRFLRESLEMRGRRSGFMKTRVVVMCPDDFRPYLERYSGTLRAEDFEGKRRHEYVRLREALEAAQ